MPHRHRRFQGEYDVTEPMLQDGKLYIGTSRKPDDTINKGEYLDLKFANRHGLVTGATLSARPPSSRVRQEASESEG